MQIHSRTLRSAAAYAKASIMTVTLLASAAATAQTNPYQKGPAPTVANLEASTGTFATRTTTISRTAANGFGGGTVYYPTTSGTYGAIAIAPGYTAYQSSMSWLGTRLASRGFVVITIDTNTTSDQPDSRGRQLKAALDQVARMSRTAGNVIYNKVDTARMGVAGHSMGGGGTLAAARDNPSLKAAVPIAPWHTTKSWSSVTVPTLIIGGETDAIAGVSSHSIPFYNSIRSTTPKAYAELNGEGHFFPQLSSNYPLVGRYMISWFKRFIDNDTRFSPFLCGAPHQADLGLFSDFSDYRKNCPY